MCQNAVGQFCHYTANSNDVISNDFIRQSPILINEIYWIEMRTCRSQNNDNNLLHQFYFVLVNLIFTFWLLLCGVWRTQRNETNSNSFKWENWIIAHNIAECSFYSSVLFQKGIWTSIIVSDANLSYFSFQKYFLCIINSVHVSKNAERMICQTWFEC